MTENLSTGCNIFPLFDTIVSGVKLPTTGEKKEVEVCPFYIQGVSFYLLK